MTLRSLLLVLLVITGCASRRPLGARVSTSGRPFAVPGATAAVPLVAGGVVRFPAQSGSVVLALPGGAARSESETLADARGVTAGKAQAGTQLVVERGAAEPVALSNPVEQVMDYDLASRGDATLVAWCGRAGSDFAVRAASIDAAGQARASRVPFDPSWAYACAPSISPIGRADEGSLVVAYESGADEESPRSVRVARFVKSDGGSLRGGSPKPAAYRFETSRAAVVAATDSFGLVAFEGTPRGDEPAIYIVAIDAVGDVDGEPIAIAPIHDGEVTRARPAPFFFGGAWYLAWEESRAGRPREVVVQPLRVE